MQSKVHIFPAVEREATSIPISSFLSKDNKLQIFPAVTSKAYFEIRYKNDQLILVAGKYIGLIPINEEVAIDVRPKVGIGSLVHIISKSREYLDSLEFFERYYNESGKTSPTIFDFFASCLSNALQKLEQEGLYKQYLKRQENLSGPRGHLDVRRTALTNWACSKYYKAFCEYFEFTANNCYNRMIKFTLWYCLNHLLNINSSNRTLIRSLAQFYDYFESVPLDKSLSFLPPVISDIHDQKIPTLRAYYENICKICRCIIEDVGISLTDIGEDVNLLSFIINMENVFERYLLYILRESFILKERNVAILDGNREGKGYLFRDTKAYEAKPDIIIREAGKTAIIIDAKYKKKASDSDRHQIVSHSLSYGVKKAVLALPSTNPNIKGLVRIGEVGDDFRVEVFEYYMDLESDDLLQEEKNYINEVNKLLQ